MNFAVGLLDRVAATLMQLAAADAPPEAARLQLRRVESHHPGVTLTLLPESDGGGTYHYDVIVDLPGEPCTLALTVAHDRGVPWSLRAAERSSDKQLVRVNDQFLMFEDAVGCLDFVSQERPIAERIVDIGIVRGELAQRDIELTDVDVQAGLNEFRLRRRLFTQEETQQWMQRHGVTTDKLRQYAIEQARMAKLRHLVAGRFVDDHLAERRADYDELLLTTVTAASRAAAASLAEHAHASTLLAAARALFVEGGAAMRVTAAFSRVPRWQAGELAPLFEREPGAVVGPVSEGAAYAVVELQACSAASPGDERTRRAAQERLFQDWLAAKRRDAQIEWYWGNPNRLFRYV